jgi:HD-GYP domain-containing protein (c-di-GMP phosphodiesterase class II)
MNKAHRQLLLLLSLVLLHVFMVFPGFFAPYDYSEQNRELPFAPPTHLHFVPDNILNKPGRLTPEEYEVVKRHPEFGWTVIRKLPGLEQTSLYVLHHHENFDGTGYPARLKGSEIPIGSRIVSVIDAFDAMVSSRPYRNGLPIAEAIRRLTEASGTQFDPSVIHSFVPIAASEMPAVLQAVGVGEFETF